MFFTPLDALDIVLVAVLLYQGYKLVANSRTINLVRGLVVFGIVWYGSSVLDLRTIHFILSQIATVGFFALIVVFQPELRAVLERLGRAQAREDAPANVAIQEIIRASERLAERKIGALIALERKTPLGEYAATGVKLDAEVTAVTLETVFARNTPLHDGGVIVQHGRLSSAGCLFPLQAPSGVVQRLYGTRHRAALGLSELSDAIVVVVSEERGSIRIAENGQLSPDLSIPELRERLREGIYHVSQGNKNFLPSAWSSVLRRKPQTFETKKETAPVATPPSEEVSARVN
jgi:diadenylate cyclase